MTLRMHPATAAVATTAAALLMAAGYLLSRRARSSIYRSIFLGSTWSAEKAAMGLRLQVNLNSLRAAGWSLSEIEAFQKVYYTRAPPTFPDRHSPSSPLALSRVSAQSIP